MSFTVQNLSVTDTFNLPQGEIDVGANVLTLPSATDTLVGQTTAATLTNKTINDPSNNVGANSLYNDSVWSAPLGGASAPVVGDVLTFVAGGSIQFQPPSGSGSLITGTGSGTGVTPVVLASVPLPTAGQTVFINTDVVGDSGTDGYASVIKAAFKNVGGTVTQVGGAPVVATEVYADPALAGVVVSYVISGTNINVQVVGVVAATINYNSYSVVRYSP